MGCRGFRTIIETIERVLKEIERVCGGFGTVPIRNEGLIDFPQIILWVNPQDNPQDNPLGKPSRQPSRNPGPYIKDIKQSGKQSSVQQSKQRSVQDILKISLDILL